MQTNGEKKRMERRSGDEKTKRQDDIKWILEDMRTEQRVENWIRFDSTCDHVSKGLYTQTRISTQRVYHRKIEQIHRRS